MKEYIKWDLGCYRYLHEKWFIKIDEISIEEQPVQWQLPLIKGKELVHNMDRRLFNIFKHIPIPEDAAYATALSHTNENLDAKYTDILLLKNKVVHQEKEGNADIIVSKIKKVFKAIYWDGLDDNPNANVDTLVMYIKDLKSDTKTKSVDYARIALSPD